MTTNEPHGHESIDPRTKRALTEYMSVLPEGGDVYTVVGQNGGTYQVDGRTGVCTCADFEYRQPEGGCKHVRRVAFATGDEPIPAGVDGVDEQLGEHTDGQPVTADGGQGQAVATDGGVAGGYTEHVEPPEVGGERYVRCEGCGRELLCSLGGRERLPHPEGCPNAGD